MHVYAYKCENTSLYIYIYTLYVYPMGTTCGTFFVPSRSSTGCNRVVTTNCKLSAGHPGETGPIRHHLHHCLHRRPSSIILRVICSALLYTVEQKKSPTPLHTTCHQQFYSRLTSDRIPFKYTIFFFTCPSQNKT